MQAATSDSLPYAFTATNRKGVTEEKCMGAASREEAIKKLRDQGYEDIKPMHDDLTIQSARMAYVNCAIPETEKDNAVLGDPALAWLKKKPEIKQLIDTAKKKSKPETHDKVERKVLTDAYSKILMNLQACEITINFDAFKWFNKENNREIYTHEFEGSAESNYEIKITDGSRYRNEDDVRTTDNFKGGNELMQTGDLKKHDRSRLEKHRNAMIADRAKQPQKIQIARNRFEVPKPEKLTYYTPTNERFAGRTRQVFAALNYGSRRNGCAPFYGCSHMVLSNKFSSGATYFPCDTIDTNVGRMHRLAPSTLASVLGMDPSVAREELKNAIYDNCFKGLKQPNINYSNGNLLFEAHLFEEVRFSMGAVKEIYISFEIIAGSEYCSNGEMNDDSKGCRTQIEANAKKWCDKFGVKFNWSPPM